MKTSSLMEVSSGIAWISREETDWIGHATPTIDETV